MSDIYVTSDLHLCHDREFIYGPRGFSCIEKMNETIIEQWKKLVQPQDTVILLGDVMLGDNEKGLECAKQLNGRIHLYQGNHDTMNRISSLCRLETWFNYGFSSVEKIYGYNFYFSHFPTITSSLSNDAPLERILINIHGHTHSKQKFFYDVPFMYNAALDAHNCTPILLDEVIDDIKKKIDERKALL